MIRLTSVFWKNHILVYCVHVIKIKDLMRAVVSMGCVWHFGYVCELHLIHVCTPTNEVGFHHGYTECTFGLFCFFCDSSAHLQHEAPSLVKHACSVF